MKVLHSICQQIWKTHQWPQDWKRSVFIPIPKKGNAEECSTAAAAAKSLSVVSDSVQPHRLQPTRLPHPWDSPGKNTGVGCHCLLQCMKVKSLTCVRLFATPWTEAYQAPLSMGFSREEANQYKFPPFLISHEIHRGVLGREGWPPETLDSSRGGNKNLRVL